MKIHIQKRCHQDAFKWEVALLKHKYSVKNILKSADVKLCKLTWNRSKNGVNFQASNSSSLKTTFEYKYTCVFLDLFQCKISIDILYQKLNWLILGSVQVNRSFKSFSGQEWSLWSFGGRCESAILGRLFGA